MADIRIVSAGPEHVAALGRCLRSEDAREVRALGVQPLHAVHLSYQGSVMAKAAFVGGEVAAMWGVSGSLLGGLGRPWLLTAPPCKMVSPLTFARIYCGEAHAMLDWFPRLENYVDARYMSAVRMLQLAGFTVDDPKPYGLTGELFRRFEMRAV